MPGNTIEDVKNLQARANAVGKDMTSGCFAFFKMMFGFFILGLALLVLRFIIGML